MNTEKTPLVHKLILGVLSLILVCLVVLIAQNRSSTVVSMPEVNTTTAEPATPTSQIEETPAPTQPKESPRPARTTPPVPDSSRSATAQSAPASTPVIIQAQPQPAPEPYTTLVNPVGRRPVDISLRPQTPVLQNEICGRVRLEGVPPPEVPISLDAQCRRLHDRPLTTRHYLVGREHGLANVLVYIKDGVHSAPQPPATNLVFNAIGCLFEPYVMGIQTGQKLTIQNSDSLLHNFHATAKANREFNLSLAARGSRTTLDKRSFDNPEVFVRIKCDVHPWEFAHIGVVQHPFFAVTDTNGVFCLPAGLPHGRYVLAAVHPKAGETLREIIVQDEPAAPLELALGVPHNR